jgi:hypothetical protein
VIQDISIHPAVRIVGRGLWGIRLNRLHFLRLLTSAEQVADGSTNKDTLVTDVWRNDGVQYTIDAKVGVGAVVAAQKEDAKTAHSHNILIGDPRRD